MHKERNIKYGWRRGLTVLVCMCATIYHKHNVAINDNEQTTQQPRLPPLYAEPSKTHLLTNHFQEFSNIITLPLSNPLFPHQPPIISNQRISFQWKTIVQMAALQCRITSTITSTGASSSSVPCIHSVQFDTDYSPIAPK